MTIEEFTGQREPTSELLEMLPPGVALSWGLNPAGSRGPKPGMSVPKIVEAAIEVADDGGLSAVSMKSVADRLGFTAMSLYRYLNSKDDLLILMLDAGFGPVPESIENAECWREKCSAWARGVYRVVLLRPWLIDIPIGGAPMTYYQMRWLESCLQALADTTLSGDEKLHTALTLSSISMANARLTRDMSRGQVGSDETGAKFEQAMIALLPRGEFPELEPLVRAGEFSNNDSEASKHEHFEFALALILDGVARRMEAKR
ncbi:transcriptional regulator, TetR family [Renibacterium salmoninarum ATCC 33209]|uniref:Transcriptional regulator, TetR family n=1 Tax=Renibacterium salmoninarum (strain ATCC 33209 / DSM 20767 / JCM 11484 / NBRC 15589 / NCIMB 2235) TaxID=288705 RepID=A9WUN2_RENSM|nr:TetR/AcrR family transcriptional regulator [Renibacterium salmoninarum]ABY24903.1 transcriptional regulator, TetR family [Renibacterium salmoninarum ATCC 33209]